VLSIGCQTGTTPTAEGIAPIEISVARKHPASVSVHVRGGGKDFRISDESLRQAIARAIEHSQVFATLEAAEAAQYRLDVVIGSARYPAVGLAMTVDLETIWQLQRVEGGEVVWQETIKASHTAAAGEAFVGVVRVRLATEGAARKCIEQGIAKLSALALPEAASDTR
jgi:hypothetical protein